MNNLDHNFKKKYGQNFLIDDNIIKKIISSVSLEKEDLVIEIGPGSGVLTKELTKKSKVLAYEIDKDLENVLSFGIRIPICCLKFFISSLTAKAKA